MQPFSRRVPKYIQERPALEYLKQPLYAGLRVNQANVTRLSFFTTPLSANLTLRDTNMRAAGVLNNPQTFDVFSLDGQLAPGTPLEDHRRWYRFAFLTLRIGSKDYLEIPLESVPSAIGLTGATGVVTESEFQNGVGHLSNSLNLSIQGSPIHIPSLQSFSVNVEIQPAQQFDVPLFYTLYLRGVQGREVQ